MLFNTNAKAQFIRVVCKECEKDQILFSRATMRVKCGYCGHSMTTPKGGNCELSGCRLVENVR